jgi:hypothetical protein
MYNLSVHYFPYTFCTCNALASSSNVMLQQAVSPTAVSMPQLGPGQIMSGGTIYQMVHTPQGLVAQPIQVC